MKIVKKESDVLKFETVEVRDATVGDLIQAERVAGKAEGMAFVAALLAQVATFDGRKVPAEELHRLSAADLAELGNAVAPSLGGAGQAA
jgi:hypothetical protein